MNDATTPTFQSVAQQIYKSMMSYFDPSYTNRWTYGNAFDSMADFLMLTNQSAGSHFLEKVYTSFSLPGAWYDDFCWPAIASLKAYDDAYSEVFKGTSVTFNRPYTKLFQDYVLTNWKVVHDGDPPSPVHTFGTQNVWACINQQKWAAFTPRFLGGSWQCDINSDKNNEGNESQNPATNELGPFQDSVMNGLLLIFSTRLGQLASEPNKYPNAQTAAAQAQKAQTNEIGFLLNWYGNGASSDMPNWETAVLSFPSETDYNNHDYSKGVLVRERIGTYAKQGSTYPPVKAFDKDRFWGGDQGLQLGGLIDQTSSDTTIDAAVGIIKGVKDRLTYTDVTGNPWIRSCEGWRPGDVGMCPSCYNAGGGGIFMRNLLYAMRTGNQKVLDYVTSKDYLKYMGELAHTALTGPSPNYDQNPLFVHLTRLAVLNVAMYYENVLNIKLPMTA